MQAGLSWVLVLKKRKNLNNAFAQFNIDDVANFNDADRARLLDDDGIIRNRLKINAIIENARRVQTLRDTHDGFANWIAIHHPMTKPEWVKLFKKTFKFTGGEITGEFLMSTGYLPGAHRNDCPNYKITKKLAPPWMNVYPEFYND